MKAAKINEILKNKKSYSLLDPGFSAPGTGYFRIMVERVEIASPHKA